MTRNSTLFITILIIAGCKEPKEAFPTSSNNPQDTIKRLNIQPNNFTEIDTGGVAMFPLSMTESTYDKSRSYKDMPNNDNWNILFYDSNTGSYHLLTDKKILIQGYYLGGSDEYSDASSTNKKFIFYTARTEDYNRDNLINEKDPLYLFATNRNGYELRHISPSGYDLSDWKYFKHSNKVILTSIFDKNQDSSFSLDEEHLVFENSLELNSKPTQIFATDFVDSLKLNFGRYWHRIRK